VTRPERYAEATDEVRRIMGALVSGPPWILGYRGSPREAPENTLAGLARAHELGLDGVGFDARACASGELVALHDATLERTTDGEGALDTRTVVELSELDAGSWFHARFRGERLPLIEEALELWAGAAGPACQIVHLRSSAQVARVAELVRALPRPRSVRVASPSRTTCLELRDAGLEAMLCVERVDEDVRRFARDERVAAVYAGPAGWSSAGWSTTGWSTTGRGADDDEWPCEAWAGRVDEPEDLLRVCRAPLFGFETGEPVRALATRALVSLAPDDDGPFPVRAPLLYVDPEGLEGGGDWSGSWDVTGLVRNPFPFSTRVTAGVLVRHGAFEVEGLPVALELAPGEEAEVELHLTGGSWSPGGDPVLFGLYRWGTAGGAGSLLLDAPLRRVRTVVADAIARRLVLLREAPRQREASMVVRRQGPWLLVSIENDGGVREARTLVHLDGRAFDGGKGVRVPLPEDFDRRSAGVPFSCGIVGRAGAEPVLRRWAGGLPDELGSGSPGVLLPLGLS